MTFEEDRRRDRNTLVYAIGLALIFHWIVVAMIPKYRDEPMRITQLESEFVEVVEPATPPPPEPEPETPPPAPEPVHHAPPVVRERAPEPPPSAPPPSAPPPPAQETPVDFGGVNLSNDNGGFAVQAASGQDRGDRIGTPGATVTGRSVQGVPGGTPGGTGTGPALLSEANQSRHPEPPGSGFDAILQRNYPEEAKRQGISGFVLITMVIDANGRPRSPRIVRESPANEGFGAACRRTVLDGPAWSPALDREGHPGSVIVNFNCRFDVNQ